MADTVFEHKRPISAADFARQRCAEFGVELTVVRNPKRTYLEMVEHRGMFPSAQYRQCTSDLKRGPIEKYIRSLPHSHRELCWHPFGRVEYPSQIVSARTQSETYDAYTACLQQAPDLQPDARGGAGMALCQRRPVTSGVRPGIAQGRSHRRLPAPVFVSGAHLLDRRRPPRNPPERPRSVRTGERS